MTISVRCNDVVLEYVHPRRSRLHAPDVHSAVVPALTSKGNFYVAFSRHLSYCILSIS